MGINLKVGDKIPLHLLLDTRPTNKFVRATVKDNTGTQIAGSPANVPHVGLGVYESLALTMPSKPHIIVEYDVFEDSGFTIPAQFESETERFDLDELATVAASLDASATSLAASATSLAASATSLAGSATSLDDTADDLQLVADTLLNAARQADFTLEFSDEERIDMAVSEQSPLEGMVDEPEIIGSISGEEKIEVTVDGNGPIEAELEC